MTILENATSTQAQRTFPAPWRPPFDRNIHSALGQCTHPTRYTLPREKQYAHKWKKGRVENGNGLLHGSCGTPPYRHPPFGT